MAAWRNYVGSTFGSLTAVERVPSPSGTKYRCVCECGNETVVRGAAMVTGNTTSCGCKRISNGRKIGKEGYKHGSVNHPLYMIWNNMKARCRSPNATGFENYGGRGISVCDRWLDFKNFCEDMGPRPSLQHTLDRKNNDLGYEPSNCRWATKKEQSVNRSVNRLITYKGKTLTMTDWSIALGGGRNMVSARVRNGWSEEDAVSIPPKKKND